MSLIISYLSNFFFIIFHLIIKYLSTFFQISTLVKGCIRSIMCMIITNSNMCGGCRQSIIHYLSIFFLIIISLIVNYLSAFFFIKIIFRRCICSVLSILSFNSLNYPPLLFAILLVQDVNELKKCIFGVMQ